MLFPQPEMLFPQPAAFLSFFSAEHPEGLGEHCGRLARWLEEGRGVRQGKEGCRCMWGVESDPVLEIVQGVAAPTLRPTMAVYHCLTRAGPLSSPAPNFNAHNKGLGKVISEVLSISV